MRALRGFSLVFLLLALVSWGVYFGIDMLPVPFIKVTIRCEDDRALREIDSKYSDSILERQKVTVYKYEELPYYIVGWESESKERLTEFKEAINAYLKRRKLPYRVALKKLGDKWILKVNRDYKDERIALKVQGEIYNKGDGYYLEVMRKKRAIPLRGYQVIVEIPRDRLPELMDFIDALKAKYPDDELLGVVNTERVYRKESGEAAEGSSQG